MSRPASIFISYRRSDSISEAGRIYDRLVAHFGHEHVFKDLDNIPPGADFVNRLDEAISECEVALVIIGQTWLNVKRGDGTRRLDDPQDFVRIEVESALRRGIHVIPVLLEGVSMPSSSQLPKTLQPLSRRNGSEVGYDPRFHADMSRLIKGIETLPPVQTETSRPDSAQSRSSQPVEEPARARASSSPMRRSISSPRTRRSSENGHRPSLLLLGHLTRRRLLQIAGGAGAGLGAVLLGRIVLQSFDSKPPEPEPEPTIAPEPEPAIELEPEPAIESEPEPAIRIEDLGNGVSLEMVGLPAGSYQMGSPPGEGAEDEYPQRPVTVDAFLMGKYPITQAQWRVVAALPKVNRDLDPSPSSVKGDTRPVESVNWFAAIEFCRRLSQHTGREYRLPSEAEWEYACRAGTTTPFHFGETITPDLVNYGNHYKGTTEVDKFTVANPFGLYDMHGNVWEWCLDHWHENYQDAPSDGSPWKTGGDDLRRLLRGGSWKAASDTCRSAKRYRYHPVFRSGLIGLRVVSVSVA